MERATRKEIFRFLDLPAELRCKIYQYLLSTKYTKVELTYHRRGPWLSLPSYKPPHFYGFHTNILYANRQIYSEAADILYSQNLFVALTYTEPDLEYDTENLVIVARGYHARKFKRHSLEVHVAPNRDVDERLLLPREPIIIAGDDLPHSCNIIPGLCYENLELRNSKYWDQVKVSVDINVRSIAIPENHKVSFSHDPPSVRRLLEPFRRLYGLRVRVRGHVTTSYKEDIEESAAQVPPTATALMCMASNDRDEGDDAMRNGDLDTALTRYRSALDILVSTNIRFVAMLWNNQMLELLPNERERIPMGVLELRLRSILAGTYLKIGAYAESYGCAQELETFNLDLFPDALRPDLGHTMFCKALAGKALGEPVQALRDIDEALKYCPDDRAMKEERNMLCGLV